MGRIYSVYVGCDDQRASNTITAKPEKEINKFYGMLHFGQKSFDQTKLTSLGTLFVHNPISTFPTTDSIFRPHFIFAVTFCRKKNKNVSRFFFLISNNVS